MLFFHFFFFFSSRRRHTRLQGDWSSDVCSSDLKPGESPGVRYVQFERWLQGVGARAALIAYEPVRLERDRIAPEVPYGFVTRVQGYCAERGIEHATAFPPAMKLSPGRGNARK